CPLRQGPAGRDPQAVGEVVARRVGTAVAHVAVVALLAAVVVRRPKEALIPAERGQPPLRAHSIDLLERAPVLGRGTDALARLGAGERVRRGRSGVALELSRRRGSERWRRSSGRDARAI